MIKRCCLALVILSLLSGWGCNKKPGAEQLVVINVLDKKLFDDCHITGSINVPFDELEEFAGALDQTAHVVVYCSNYMCMASMEGARMFRQRGFENAWAYEAGMAGWYQDKLPYTGPAQEKYLTRENKPIERAEKDLAIATQELQKKMASMKLYNS